MVNLLRTCILLFTSSGKLENQKTVLTNIGSQIKRGSLAMHAIHWALKPRCHCWSRSTTSLQTHNWQLVSSFLQQMAVLKCVDGGWHVECLVICRLSVIFSWEDRAQLPDIIWRVFRNHSIWYFWRCLMSAYIRILVTPIPFCWVNVILVFQMTKYGVNLYKSTTSSNEYTLQSRSTYLYFTIREKIDILVGWQATRNMKRVP